MNLLDHLPPTSTRVERSTDPAINDVLRGHADARLVRLQDARPEQFAMRLEELDREWDVERLLQANASTLVLAGWRSAMRWTAGSCCCRPPC
jgi:hypothetical protein